MNEDTWRYNLWDRSQFDRELQKLTTDEGFSHLIIKNICYCKVRSQIQLFLYFY